MHPPLGRGGPTTRKFAISYAVLALATGSAITVALLAGSHGTSQRAIAGRYQLVKPVGCLAGAGSTIVLVQSGQFVDATTASGKSGQLRLLKNSLSGEIGCNDGTREQVNATVASSAKGLTLSGAVGDNDFAAVRQTTATTPPNAAPPHRSNEETFGRLVLAIAVVILAARVLGAVVRRLGQPQVMGEVIAGILLGPTLLGTVLPGVSNYLFPADIVPLLGGAADIGLAFFMFLIGLELDVRALRGRAREASLISNAGVALPLAVGIGIAVPLYGLLAPATTFASFALFVGVAMSITAVPVLARILLERRMLGSTVGAVTMAAAAVDDVTAWGLLALATAVAGSGSGLTALRVVGLAGVFCAGMLVVGRRLLARLSTAYDEAGSIPPGWIATIFVSVLVSAYIAQQIGIAAIFGAFMLGLVMPRRAELSHDVNERLSDFVTTVLLPLFFVIVGLKTQIGLLNRGELWGITVLLVAAAIFAKGAGTLFAATVIGYPPRMSAVIATLMNTRGLTELIVLNIALELGAISPALFSMLVVMALVTTFMAGPLLRLLDPRGIYSVGAEEELRGADRAVAPEVAASPPARSILVSSGDDQRLVTLLDIAEPLALSEPSRELILVRLVEPSPLPTGLTGDDRNLRNAAAAMARERAALSARHVAVRAVAFTSADPGADLVRLASESEVDLVLLEGRRPLLGVGVPRGAVGTVLQRAPGDVAVLVDRERRRSGHLGRGPVIVPFGGAEHDWAALELGSWLASARGVPLRVLGAHAGGDNVRDASRLLADASLLVQRFTGVDAEPLLVERGRAGIMAAAVGAGLLVIGLSERWRREGLGEVRAAIAQAAPAPILFVRRGTRAGALAPADDVTRFTWSRVAPPSTRT